MSNEKFEMQENIRRLVSRIIKHYRGKGPDCVKVQIEEKIITIHISGILSNLSEILVGEGADEVVKDYWRIMKPHLEKQFLDEAYKVVGKRFEYSWKIDNWKNSNRTITIFLKLIDNGSIRKKND
ncbi:Na-translocating system protein MpsC family protein [Clostridium thailandense]|uniref:DUF2294 family protein n=1 Tax=Clostridium thailandense TaxID=2794346 RepID=A0A949WTZ9_9CLOT|nr:Na-translocating system protein MpsC family protein [Clostridium thailandense]MBV7272047.1 DUF2294 family protein [Clostridium thailandense]MCH5137445.1 DUF2294 family protein [Clostridiaceae bacterium UIB06]